MAFRLWFDLYLMHSWESGGVNLAGPVLLRKINDAAEPGVNASLRYPNVTTGHD